MASTSPTYSGSVSTTAAGGSVNWVNTANVTGSNESTSTSVTLSGQTSYALDVTNFGFSLPNSTIDGIQVEYRIDANNQTKATAEWQTVQLIIGGTATGQNKGTGYVPTTVTNSSFGGSADLWTLTPSYTDINASNFGVRLQVVEIDDRGSDSDVFVWWVRITVTYTESGGGGPTSFQKTCMFFAY